MSEKGSTAVLVTKEGRFFCWVAAQLAPRFEWDDESFISVIQTTTDPTTAKVYDSRRDAERALKRMQDRWVRGSFDLGVAQ